MELKSCYGGVASIAGDTSNRTKMELKCSIQTRQYIQLSPFQPHQNGIEIHLIETGKREMIIFQPHQNGIEINKALFR